MRLHWMRDWSAWPPGIVDEPITYASGKVVRNADGRYRGLTTVRDAITDSVNVVAVKTSRMVTLEKCFQSVLNFGFTTLEKENDMVEALPLGGITDGVTNVELTAAYAAIANGRSLSGACLLYEDFRS